MPSSRNAAAKARHGMNEAIARLSTGVRAMYGGDAGGASAAMRSEPTVKVLNAVS